MLRRNQIQWMRAVICLLIVGFLVLSGRLTYIQAYRHNKYKGISEGRVNRTEFYSPRRGEIRDINGNQLAVTRDVRTVVLDPGLLDKVDPVTRREYLDLVSSLLHLDRAWLIEKSRFFRSQSGDDWVLLMDSAGMPLVTASGIPIYSPLNTNGVVDSEVMGIAVVDETNQQLRDRQGKPLYALLNKDREVITNRYVRLLKELPVEEWEQVRRQISQFPIDETREGYSRRSAIYYRALRSIVLYSERDFKREYPNGRFMAHLLGYTESGEKKLEGQGGSITVMKGLEGVERALDDQLTGTVGWRNKVVRSDGSEILSSRGHSFEAGDGLTAVLTLDSIIQGIVEDELRSAIERHAPKSASCVVAEVKTGRILAYAVAPDYDPNLPAASEPENWRNRIIMDLMEPGSTFKVVAFCAALNEGRYGVRSPVDCSSWNRAEWGRRPKEASGGDYGTLTMEEMLAKSSNIGFAKMGWMLSPSVLNQYIRNFGYRSPTGIMLPGERTHTNNAIIPDKDKLSISRVPIGQGIAVNQLQTTMAMGAVANGGILMRPQILDHLEDRSGRYAYEQMPQPVRRVMSEKVAKEAVQALRKVTERTRTQTGTAWRADMKYHTVGGKTGTAQKAAPGGGGYHPDKYYASFVGFFPTADPVIVMSVVVDEPSRASGYYGGTVAAPIFKDIAEGIAIYWAIPPDKELEPPTQRR